MKLLTDSPEGIKFKEFSNDTPYVSAFILCFLNLLPQQIRRRVFILFNAFLSLSLK